MRDRPLMLLTVIAIGCVIAYMTIGLRGDLGFVLGLRATRLFALIQVGVAIGVSTLVFQTVTGNRILTPSIMGIDALYLFGQILLVFMFGGLAYSAVDPHLKFTVEVAALMVMTIGLILPLLSLRWDMGLMLLVGVVVGVLFRSLHSLLARLIDPNEFAIVQGNSFANFNDLNADLLAMSSVLSFAALVLVWRARHVLDVLALGRDASVGLGVDWSKHVVGFLVVVAVLVAVSTALVGPVAFLGLLVVALAEKMINSRRHAWLLPATALVAIIVLVGGQTVFQHALGNSATLGVVIEFGGGLVFLVLLWKRSRV